MTDSTSLLDLLLDRVDGSGLSDDAQLLVLAAYQGGDELAQALSGVARQSARLDPPVVEHGKPVGAYLQSVEAESFRGVGPAAALRLTPGPGLTLVVGRNGSGKSSFAEAVEVALTGTNARWQQGQGVAWRDGWRNLHHPAAPRVTVELLIEGDPRRTTVTRSWPDGDVDDSQAWVQRPGAARAALDTLGWESALTTYRPFLSYAELGAMLTGKPSELYDALFSILGLRALADAELRLNERRKELNQAVTQPKTALPPLLERLRALDDDRARKVTAALSGRTWRLAEVAAVVTGAAQPEAGDLLQRLRAVMALTAPDAATVVEAVRELRSAAAALDAVRGTEADDARRLAGLLQSALDHHSAHRETRCPVCGSEDRLGEPWRAHTVAEVERLRAAAAAAEAAHQQIRHAMQRARAVISPVPSLLGDNDVSGVDLTAVRAAWRAHSDGVDHIDGRGLADHLERTAEPLRAAVEEVQRHAQAEHERREDRWQPVAVDLASWLEHALRVEQDRPLLANIKAAYDWLRGAAQEIRDERLAPLARRSGEIWETLRQESNIDLGPVRLEGIATRRRVALDVAVDGVEGAALGVMSQGELHALALALFLPRATMDDSPFRFLLIDDPVQAMDPAKVDGLARVLAATARHRQVVVFTHDDRLPEAVRRLQLPATIWQVVRRERSMIETRKLHDPVARYLDDARALASTAELPAGVAARVVPGFCRSAVEAACQETVRRRWLSAGRSHAEIEAELGVSRTLTQTVALALFDDDSRGGEVRTRLNTYGCWAGDAFAGCRTGGHDAYRGDSVGLVNHTKRLADKLRER